MTRSRDGRRPGTGAGSKPNLATSGHGFTETVERYQRRLRRDRVVGISGLAVSLLVLVVNLVMRLGADLPLLPGGHSPLYFLAGMIGAGWSAWVAFDLGNTRRQRR